MHAIIIVVLFYIRKHKTASLDKNRRLKLSASRYNNSGGGDIILLAENVTA